MIKPFEKEVRKAYRQAIKTMSWNDAYNKVLASLGGCNNELRRKIGDILRQPWRESLDRRIGIKSGKGDTYKVYNLDVWGNSKEGFEVNNQFFIGEIFIPECASDRDLLRIMRKQFLSEASKGAVRIENGSAPDYIQIEDRKTGEPIFQLELVRKED